MSEYLDPQNPSPPTPLIRDTNPFSRPMMEWTQPLSILNALAKMTSGDLLFPGKRQLESRQTQHLLDAMSKNQPTGQ